jgi:hypothetical protein
MKLPEAMPVFTEERPIYVIIILGLKNTFASDLFLKKTRKGGKFVFGKYFFGDLIKCHFHDCY